MKGILRINGHSFSNALNQKYYESKILRTKSSTNQKQYESRFLIQKKYKFKTCLKDSFNFEQESNSALKFVVVAFRRVENVIVENLSAM